MWSQWQNGFGPPRSTLIIACPKRMIATVLSTAATPKKLRLNRSRATYRLETKAATAVGNEVPSVLSDLRRLWRLPVLRSEQGPDHRVQSALFNPLTRRNTRSCVTSIASDANACAAIIMSRLPIGSPFFSKSASNCA